MAIGKKNFLSHSKKGMSAELENAFILLPLNQDKSFGFRSHDMTTAIIRAKPK